MFVLFDLILVFRDLFLCVCVHAYPIIASSVSRKIVSSLSSGVRRKIYRYFRLVYKGEEEREGDLDVLVEFEESADLSLLGFIRLENHLSGELGVEVDLVEKRALKPRIGKRILEEVVSI